MSKYDYKKQMLMALTITSAIAIDTMIDTKTTANMKQDFDNRIQDVQTTVEGHMYDSIFRSHQELEKKMEEADQLMKTSIEEEVRKIVDQRISEQEAKRKKDEADSKGISLGEYRISFYDTSHNSQEGWGYQTASGVSLRGRSIKDRFVACPPEIPMGSKLYIEFPDNPELTGIYTCVDRGGAIKGKKIDMFYEDYNMEGSVWDMGIKYANVYIKQ